MRLWYLSHRRATEAQVSLSICADSREPSLLAYTKYGRRYRPRTKFSPIVPLDTRGHLWEACAHMRYVPEPCAGSNVQCIRNSKFSKI